MSSQNRTRLCQPVQHHGCLFFQTFGVKTKYRDSTDRVGPTWPFSYLYYHYYKFVPVVVVLLCCHEKVAHDRSENQRRLLLYSSNALCVYVCGITTVPRGGFLVKEAALSNSRAGSKDETREYANIRES